MTKASCGDSAEWINRFGGQKNRPAHVLAVTRAEAGRLRYYHDAVSVACARFRSDHLADDGIIAASAYVHFIVAHRPSKLAATAV